MRTRRPIRARDTAAGPARARPSTAVLALQAVAGNRATAGLLQRRPAGFAGLKLGRNRAGREVEVKREVGTPGGYGDRLQAVAVARLARVDPAAVGRDAAGRWHAFELTEDFHGATYAAPPGGQLAEVHGLPSAAGIAGRQATVDRLKAHGQDVAAELAATRDLYALILGVDGGEVLINRSSHDRKAGKVNVTAALAKDPEVLGRHGRESRQHEEFEAGAPSALELNPVAFDTPARAQAVLFHEAGHLEDYERTQHWVTAYERTGAVFVAKAGRKPFHEWLKTKTTAAEARLVVDITEGTHGTTEARAYVRTFIAAFDAGAEAEAANQLVTYGRGMARGRIAVPTQERANEVIQELERELAAYRRRLDATRRKAFDAALKAAVKENPRSWLAAVKTG